MCQEANEHSYHPSLNDYANTLSIGNKQEELKACAHLQACDLIGITQAWWDVSYDCGVGMEKYRLFRKGRQERQEEDVAFYAMTSWSAWSFA